MKFYQVPVNVYRHSLKYDSKYEVIPCGNIVVKQTLTGCEEAMTGIEILVEPYKRNDELTSFDRALEMNVGQLGFCFVVNHCFFTPQYYAKSENVKEYIEEYDQTEFSKFYDEHKYVYGTDHKEIKKMVKKAKRQK